MDAFDLAAFDLSAFDRRLNAAAGGPIGVAYSGGGDSLAALLASLAWAGRAGRKVVAIHVDHRLQAGSAAWARLAQDQALGLGADFAGLAWTGDKPVTGISAAARRARHTLIADAARAAGARVVVFGHTADDVLEAELMRAEGSSLGRPREWRPSPVWPEGRGLFLLRPLLGLRRAEIRRRLAPLGLNWVEDPANANPASLRARVRARLPDEAVIEMTPPFDVGEGLAALAEAAEVDEAGGVSLPRERLAVAPRAAVRRFLSAALVCSGGGDQPPRRERLEALAERVQGGEAFTATLAGARLEAGEAVRLAREAGSYRRHGAPVLRLEMGAAGVWDGRFALVNRGVAAAEIRPLAGLAAQLPKKQHDSLASVPAALRGGLPAAIDGAGRVTCPILAREGAVSAESLVRERLYGACDMISREPLSEVLRRGVDARGGMTTGVLCLDA